MIYPTFSKGFTSLAVLIDPDRQEPKRLAEIYSPEVIHCVDYFFVGGSLLTRDLLEETIIRLKSISNVPVLLFPGSVFQISDKADALLFLSLISGRNPELLIGQHVIAAPYIKQSGLEVISTGYILIDGGRMTTVQYMSHSLPIPANKPEIAVSTALAGAFLGMKAIYLDAGSGADNPVSPEIICAVKKETGLPIIVGGGINTTEKARTASAAGADVLVVGNGLEKNPSWLRELSEAVNPEKTMFGKTKTLNS